MQRFAKLMLAGAFVAAGLAAVPAPATAAAYADEAAPAIPPPPAGMGQIVFYRSSRMGMLVSCRVREGDTVVNRLPPGKYFIQVTTPGAHEYNVRSEARDNLRLEVEDGETYYVRCAIGMGIGVGRPNLSPQSREDFERRGGGLDLMPPYVPEGDDNHH
ncbi:MAG TPA: hypothetical protein VK614_02500 [Allosphingosinicella sp.]|nr:hypothetical protein [Allosphingosinicella sp.]